MSVQVRLEEGVRRAWLTVLPKPQTATVAETVLRLTNQRPVLGSWDWIIDIRNPHAQATEEELDLIAKAFNSVTSCQSYIIFISEDPATYARCAILAQKFINRRHLVAKGTVDATRLLPFTMHSI